ncbi:hypothetical protein B0H14DRAFT_3111784 [Mycena olivaceomarginata]|nr:hypothetical protein B0H14DRAFT_3111784 [Mycena olivaceomarginata]
MAGLSIPSQPLIPDRETPSPQPLEQPLSGPNPVFLPIPKRKEPSDAAEAAEAAAEKAAADLKRAEEQAEEARRVRIYASLEALKIAGCTSTYQFFEDFFASTDREISWQASRLLNDHGTDFLNLMNAKRPDVVECWALKTSLPIIAAEGKNLSDLLRPDSTQTYTSRLKTWSLEEMLLMLMGMTSEVLVTVLCMLAQSQNERANESQEIMGTYFLACSTPRRQFDVLAHAGLTVSYSKAINDLKGLSAEGLARLRRMVQEKTCMIVWDNLNIAFKVLRSELELELLEPRVTRKPIIDFEPMDTLPSAEQILQARNSVLWHIRRILLEWFPNLGVKFKKEHGDVPVVKAIPLHQTVQLPTPAMKIDESSLDGTIEVIDTMVIRTLQLNNTGLREHGVMFAGGDLLSLSLTDKAIAARREDTNLLDRYGAYLKGMLGLFHVKLSGTRELFSDSQSHPRRVEIEKNSPSHELMLNLSLPAHILDGFRIYCGADSLDAWVKSNPSWASIVTVSEVVVEKLCSASTVEELRMLPEADRDPQLENTILCNHDMLLLLLFTTSIKVGDVGTVLNILAHWMGMFRGTGSMPKYANALFELINNLKCWPPRLQYPQLSFCRVFTDTNFREAYLNNWLVNLTGKIHAFKEVDLLQEHQDFWAKVIFFLAPSNRSWEWLSMITVVIFNLRDVMRNVQSQFKIPHHGTSHTSPQTAVDVANLTAWLVANSLQTCVKDRAGKDSILQSRDLMVVGAAYAKTPSAFRNFRGEIRKVSYKSNVTADEDDENDQEEPHADQELDIFRDAPIEQDDLMHDDEEFTGMADEFLRMAKEATGLEGM